MRPPADLALLLVLAACESTTSILASSGDPVQAALTIDERAWMFEADTRQRKHQVQQAIRQGNLHQAPAAIEGFFATLQQPPSWIHYKWCT